MYRYILLGYLRKIESTGETKFTGDNDVIEQPNWMEEPIVYGGIAPLPSRWNKGIDLVHIDLRTMDELWDSIERQKRQLGIE
tara:strand:- start:3 stop:248 length:246 start_codon:yes stop_codon:yes gene_type:complete